MIWKKNSNRTNSKLEKSGFRAAPPNKQQNFSHCSTLFSKMGQSNKIQALYYNKYTLITNFHEYVHFFNLTHFRDYVEEKMWKHFVGFLEYGKPRKIAFKINWPLEILRRICPSNFKRYYDIFWKNIQKFLFLPGLLNFG